MEVSLKGCRGIQKGTINTNTDRNCVLFDLTVNWLIGFPCLELNYDINLTWGSKPNNNAALSELLQRQKHLSSEAEVCFAHLLQHKLSSGLWHLSPINTHSHTHTLTPAVCLCVSSRYKLLWSNCPDVNVMKPICVSVSRNTQREDVESQLLCHNHTSDCLHNWLIKVIANT